MLDERWSEEANEIGEALRRLLAKENSPQHVRAAEASDDGRDCALERNLEDFGLGEMELQADILARIALELGRALAPCALIETMPARIVLGLADTANGLDGPVPAACSQVLVEAGEGVVLVQSLLGKARRTTAGDWIVDPVPAADARPAGGKAEADRIRRLAALLDSARLVGAGKGLLDYGVSYASEREQFGKRIGGYQGIAHRLADAAGALDGAELLVRKAAFTALEAAGGDGAPAPIFALMLRPKAVQAARLAATTVHQVFGGNGFAMEYDVQLFSRRIRSWSNRGRRTGADLSEIGRMVLDPARRDAMTHLWHYERGMPLPRWAREADARMWQKRG